MAIEKDGSKLLASIDAKIGEVRTEAIDLSFGEIISLKGNNEIKIDPEYQRLFRWSDEQKSRLVESILLRLPIPPVFFIENPDGTLELIDGLQRISSMLQFIESKLIELGPLKLSGCDIIEDLNDLSFEDLPLALRLQLKRSTVRAIVIKRQSKSFLRYEMFKRLNTGGALLSPQELRNCSVRLFGEAGEELYRFLVDLSKHPTFVSTTEALADSELDMRGREELVLRFFAAKNGSDLYSGHVADWLDSFLENILLKKFAFNYGAEAETFRRTFNSIDRVLGPEAFCKYKDNHAVGGLAPAHYEAIAMAFVRKLDAIDRADPVKILGVVTAARQSAEFKANVGPGANNRGKLRGRIGAIERAIDAATNA